MIVIVQHNIHNKPEHYLHIFKLCCSDCMFHILTLPILVGPFQLSLFYDSVLSCQRTHVEVCSKSVSHKLKTKNKLLQFFLIIKKLDTSQFFPSYIFVTPFSVSHYTKKTQHPCIKTSNEFLCNLALTFYGYVLTILGTGFISVSGSKSRTIQPQRQKSFGNWCWNRLAFHCGLYLRLVNLYFLFNFQ